MFIGHSIGDADGRILFVDGSVCDLLQRSRRCLIGMSYLDITHADDRPNNFRAINDLAVGSAPLELRKRYALPDGSSVLVDLQVSRFVTGPDMGRIVGTIRLATTEKALATPERLWRTAGKIDKMIALRRAVLGDDIFSDFPLLILLKAYLAEAEGRVLDPAQMAAAIALPLDVTRRWLRALRAKALVEIIDGCSVQLSKDGMRKVEHLLIFGASSYSVCETGGDIA